MSYLLIRNKGLAPIQAFTILGLSTARGETEKIGQFGSGSKHGILTLMRAAVPFSIFIGEDQLEFFTAEAQMGGKPYKEVRYSWQKEAHKTGMCLEFGALDWSDVWMSVREFICNALDQGTPMFESPSMSTHQDETRVYISLEHPGIRQAFDSLQQRFMHFEGLEDVEITPSRSEMAQFYRRGVFVTETNALKKHPLFRYNFIEGKIDESRNMDGAALGSIAARLLLKSRDHLATLFRSFGGTPCWEHDLGGAIWVNSSYQTPGAVIGAWREAYGDRPFTNDQQTLERLGRKGISPVVVTSGWSSALEEAGVVNGRRLLSDLENKGGDECEATESAVETFQRCWKWIEQARLTGGKEFPQVKCFSMPMSSGEEVSGYCRDGVVFLNLDFDTNEQTALEELSHYITGAKDETRDFQDFAFKLATRLAKLRTKGDA
jgi:hypothetical protein